MPRPSRSCSPLIEALGEPATADSWIQELAISDDQTPRWTATLTWVSARTTAWAKNASGQTYGVQNEKGTPDLIAVTATNGKDGYVYGKDLDEIDGTTASKSFTTPQQALDWQKTHHGGDIPVFKSDGTTKIGTFHVGQ
ncbi:hypothetical protein [Leifsonia sp. NPDC058230]|uniref:hypothetical protein n=1 Tax=Leifsonia sp. NPDC058230 TaxID=3346391 RepID=UPI0036DED0AD